MGLDQYAYSSAKAGQQREFYSSGTINVDTGDWHNPEVSRPREICYWRKHPNLQGWMRNLWLERGCPGATLHAGDEFNGVELELTWEDVDQLEKDILSGALARLGTTGFFFGGPSDDEYYETDLQFCRDAKADLFLGLKVFYNSSW